MIGRTHAPDSPGFTQRHAVVSALGDLGIPIVLDVHCGHVPPSLSLINGAVASVTIGDDRVSIIQQLI
jgi:muramoyltetrapeptide carboxypeptidase